jgi:hypothetical protein
MASHDLTLKNYQKQLKDNLRSIYDNYTELLKTKTEHINFEVQVKAAEIVRSYQSLMQLVSEIRTFLIINDLVGARSPAQNVAENSDEKLVKLRDEMSMFLYELEIPLP